LNEVPTSEVFDPTAIERRPGRQPLSDRRLVDRVDATWEALEQLRERTEQVMEEATV
jgi:hypothetical protein